MNLTPRFIPANLYHYLHCDSGFHNWSVEKQIIKFGEARVSYCQCIDCGRVTHHHPPPKTFSKGGVVHLLTAETPVKKLD
jgi:hypothetical protein